MTARIGARIKISQKEALWTSGMSWDLLAPKNVAPDVIKTWSCKLANGRIGIKNHTETPSPFSQSRHLQCCQCFFNLATWGALLQDSRALCIRSWWNTSRYWFSLFPTVNVTWQWQFWDIQVEDFLCFLFFCEGSLLWLEKNPYFVKGQWVELASFLEGLVSDLPRFFYSIIMESMAPTKGIHFEKNGVNDLWPFNM